MNRPETQRNAEAKDFTQRERRKGGEKFEKDRGVNRERRRETRRQKILHRGNGGKAEKNLRKIEAFAAETQRNAEAKDFTQRERRKGGEKSEKDRGVCRRDAENAEKPKSEAKGKEPAGRLPTGRQAGATRCGAAKRGGLCCVIE